MHLFTDLLYTLIVSVVPHWNVKSIINFYRINSCSTLEFLIAKIKQVSISSTGIIGVRHIKKAMVLSIKVEPYWNVKNTALNAFNAGSLIKVEPYWNYIDSYVKIVL